MGYTINMDMESNEKPVYSVVLIKDKLRCFNTQFAQTLSTYSLPGDSTVISGPTVTGDRCVVVMKTANGIKGKIFKLPSFSTITTFNA